MNGTVGAGYIDKSFTSVNVHNDVYSINTILFGKDPDAMTLNFRATQFANIVLSTDEGSNYSDNLDLRRTPNDSFWYDFPYGVSMSPMTLASDPWSTSSDGAVGLLNNNDVGIRSIGTYVGNDELGKNIETFSLTIDCTNLTQLTLTPTGGVSYSLPITPGTVNQIDVTHLPGMSLQFFNLNTLSPSSDKYSVLFTCTSKPSRSIKDIDKQLQEAGAQNLTYGLSKNDLINSFYNLARYGSSPIERVAGILLLVCASNEAARTA